MKQTVILAGGMGTRIQSVAHDLPKALLPVAGRPFLHHQLRLLAKTGVTDVLLCIGYRGDQIEAFAGDGASWGLSIQYAYEDPDALLGTGGAIVQARLLLAPVFGVLYGDSYLPFDFSTAYEALEASGLPALMCVHRNNHQWDPSNVRLSGDRVVFYSKKAQKNETDCIDYGFSVFHREVFEPYAEGPFPLDLATVMSRLVDRHQLAALEVPQRFYEIGKPEGLAELDQLLRKDQSNE